jgi:GNAT superfamily N-acetyltransferase
LDDLPIIHHLLAQFCAEAGYGWTYDAPTAEHSINTVLAHPDAATIFISGSDGLVILVTARDYTVETHCYLEKFYVAPHARGTETGRLLMGAATQWSDLKGCSDMFASATGKIGQDQLFCNLLGKFGFVPAGQILWRQRPDE